MKGKFFLKVLSINRLVMAKCSNDVQARYNTLGGNLMVSCLMAAIGGFDIAHQFTENIYLKAGASLIMALIVYSIDYTAMQNNDAHWSARALRIPVGMANVFITTTALLVMLNQSTIDNTLQQQDAETVHRLDSIYTAGKSARFAVYNKEVKDLADYHQANCIPEAKNGFPGHMYKVKDSVCVQKKAELGIQLKQLNSDEGSFSKSYQDRRLPLTKQVHNDFFAKADMLPGIIDRHPLMKWLIAAFVIVMLYIELQPIIMKLSMSNQDDYTRGLEADRLAVNELGALLHTDRIAMDRAKRETDLRIQQDAERERNMELDMDALGRTAEREGELAQSEEILDGKDYKDSARLANLLRQRNAGNFGKPQATLAGILRMNSAMRSAADDILSRTPPGERPKAFFDHVTARISYADNHGPDYYLDAGTTYNLKQGVCGESALALLAFYRYAGIDAIFVLVTTEGPQQPFSHACLGLRDTAGQVDLVDPGQQVFAAGHLSYRLLEDDELVRLFNQWNQ